MNLVCTNDQSGVDVIGSQCDEPFGSLGAENVKRRLDEIIQVELLKLRFAFLKQSPQMPDDISSAMIGLPDVGEDFLELRKIGRIGAKKELRRLGVAENGA